MGTGDGDAKSKRAAITDQTQAGNMMVFFRALPTGTKAAAVMAPPGPKATAKAQSEYHNQQRAAYDDTAPALVQMVPEIGEQAAEAELNGRFRGVLAMARGMVTGSRANSSTSAASVDDAAPTAVDSIAAHAASRTRPRPPDTTATTRPAPQHPVQRTPTPRRPSFQSGHAAAGPAATTTAAAPTAGHGNRIRQTAVRGTRQISPNVPPFRQPVRRHTARRDVKGLRRRQRPR